MFSIHIITANAKCFFDDFYLDFILRFNLKFPLSSV